MRSVCILMKFSTLYTTLPHNLIKDKLIDLDKRNLPERRLALPCMLRQKRIFYFGKT